MTTLDERIKESKKRFDEAGGNWLIHDAVRNELGNGEEKSEEERERIIYNFFFKFLKSELRKIAEEEREEIKSNKKYGVVYGNYFPREVESTWNTKEEAEHRADELNEEGSGMWEVEEF